MTSLDKSRHVEVEDGGQTVATAGVTTVEHAGGTVRASLLPSSGHTPPGSRASLVDAVMDLPEVRASSWLEATLPRRGRIAGATARADRGHGHPPGWPDRPGGCGILPGGPSREPGAGHQQPPDRRAVGGRHGGADRCRCREPAGARQVQGSVPRERADDLPFCGNTKPTQLRAPGKINTRPTRTKRYCPAPDGMPARMTVLAHGIPRAGQTG